MLCLHITDPALSLITGHSHTCNKRSEKNMLKTLKRVFMEKHFLKTFAEKRCSSTFGRPYL